MAAMEPILAAAHPGHNDRRQERLLIVTHVPHYQHRGRVHAYAPYAREIELWCQMFEHVGIAAPVRASRPSGDCATLEARNVTLHHLPESGGPGVRAKARQVALLPLLAARLVALMRSADVVHVRCPGNLGLLGAALAPIVARRRVAKYAGQWSSYRGEALTVRFQRWLLNSRWWGAPVLAYTDSSAASINVVPCFASALTAAEANRARAAAVARQSASPRGVLYVGRLSRAKNVHLLIEAIAQLAPEYPDVSCTIVGDGPARSRLEELARSLGVLDRVHFAGGLPFEAVLDFYEDADVLVLVSETEGWPKVVAEGMSFGLVCIGSDQGLLHSMLGGGRGVLVTDRTSTSLAEALRAVLALEPQRVRRIGQAAAEWASEFTLDEVQRTLAEVMETRCAPPHVVTRA